MKFWLLHLWNLAATGVRNDCHDLWLSARVRLWQFRLAFFRWHHRNDADFQKQLDARNERQDRLLNPSKYRGRD